MSDLLNIELRNTTSTLIARMETLNTTLSSFQAEMDLATTNSLLTSLQAIIPDIANLESEITACKVQLEKLKFNGDNLKTEYV